MELAVSFPSAPVIDAETRSPTLMPLMLVTLPVTVVARVTAAVIAWPAPSRVIEVALTAVTGPPISRRSVAPAGSGTPPPRGARCVPLPAPLEGAAPEPLAAGALDAGVALAAGLLVISCRAAARTPNPPAAAPGAPFLQGGGAAGTPPPGGPATSAVRASGQPRLVPFPPLRCHPPGGQPG